MTKDNILITILAIFIALVFSSWHFLPMLYGISWQSFFISSSSSFFQSIQSWQPLVSAIAEGNLFPSAPNVNMDKDFLYYPYLTLWFFALTLKIVGEFGEVFLNQIVIPTLSFAILIKIFQRYLALRWAIAIALLSVMSFSELPFREFLLGLIGQKDLKEVATLQPLEILHFPFPAFSLLAFLSIYYFSTKQIKFTNLRLSIFTILWAMTTQIHVLDAFFGLIFWFTYFPIRIYRQDQTISSLCLAKKVVLQLIIALILVFPSLFELTKNTAHLDLGILTNKFASVGLYYYFSYFLIPIFGCFLIYFIFRVDIYEIFLKFWHIYVLMFTEFVLISAVKIFDIGIDLEIIKNRIPLFFLHFYYYVPIIYFASRTINYSFKHGIESNRFISSLRSLTSWFFGSFSKFYLPLLSILLVIFALNSSFWHFQYYKSFKDISDLKINNFKEINKQLASVKEGVIVFSDPVMINMALAKSYKTLWPNHFSNNISQEEIISRIALNAKMFNWSEDEFIKFMSEGKLQEGDAQIIDLSQNIFDSGIGYWLVFHKKSLTDMEKYNEMLRNIYTDLDVNSMIKKYNITYIISEKMPSLKNIKSEEVAKINDIKIFKIYE